MERMQQDTEITLGGAGQRIQELAALLHGADMTNPGNIALRREVSALMDAFPAHRESFFSLGCSVYLRLDAAQRQSSKAAANDEKVKTPKPQGEVFEPGPVFLDTAALHKKLGRETTPDENEAIAIRMDAMACGRSVEYTVACCEVFGRGTVREEVKRILGVL